MSKCDAWLLGKLKLKWSCMVVAKLHDRWDDWWNDHMDLKDVQAKIKCKKEIFLIHVGCT